MPAKLKCLILDFDGVIVESNHIKDDAFRKILSRYPDYFSELWQYHREHNALDRYSKFNHFVTRIFGQENTEMTNRLAQEFGELTQTAIMSCPFVPGAEVFLESFVGRIPMHLASATPETQLTEILQERQLTKFFKSVTGSSLPKAASIEQIVQGAKLNVAEVLFIGDSPEDYSAAQATGIRFIARKSDRYDHQKMPEPLSDLFEVRRELEKAYDIPE